MSLSRPLCHLLCVVALTTLAANSAQAICNALNAPPPRYVGDIASDNQCTDNTIQDAITAVQNAGYVCPAKIYVTREHTYTSQHLTIDNVPEGLTIIGVGDGVHCGSTDVQICDPDTGCPPPPTQSLVTIDGGYSGSPVFSITGNSNVVLVYLHITHGGNAQTSAGGGIRFNGSGSLKIDTSEITFNEAQNGGGIHFNANGGSATLNLAANSQVLENVADASYTQGGGGGGILLAGQSHLVALQPRTLIAFNQASSGYGGGVEVLAPAVADIGSPGYNGVAVIYDNSAEYGGGIAVNGYDGSGNSSVQALARLFTTDPAHPVQVANNTASHTGGGIWLKPNFSGPQARLCANDFRIDDNIAQEGTAIYSDSDYQLDAPDGGQVYLNVAYDSPDCSENYDNPDPITNYGAEACASGVACSTMDRNIAEDNTNTPTDGSTILIQTLGELALNRVAFRHNEGGHVIRVFGSGLPYNDAFQNFLMADNSVTQEPIYIQHNDSSGIIQDGTVTISRATLANNSIAGASVIRSEHDLTFTASIVAQTGVPTLAYTGNPDYLTVQYVLSNDVSTLPVSIGVVQGAPTFVNAAGSDYHLQATSLGVDFAPASGGVDLDGLPRSTDLAPVTNVYGPRDLGAYERQYVCGADTIFCSAFDPFQ